MLRKALKLAQETSVQINEIVLSILFIYGCHLKF